jgi:hypothetical protein
MVISFSGSFGEERVLNHEFQEALHSLSVREDLTRKHLLQLHSDVA